MLLSYLQQLLLILLDLSSISSLFLRLHLIAQLHNLLACSPYFYPTWLVINLRLVFYIRRLPVCIAYGRASQPIPRVNETTRNRLTLPKDSKEVVLIR